MDNSLMNRDRPPVFCPGCTHEPITRALDKAFCAMGLKGNQIAIVSDIGCSGLFDTFFHTHALHGLHGRALTYAAGLKTARPEMTVVATMGDGGLGIGGAHFLAACRRNLDITLLVLNNFNFGMTGGQSSATTPSDAAVGSGFLNRLEKPMDVCTLAASAGAPYVVRCSGLDENLPEIVRKAIEFKGFAVADIWGLCPGRFSRKNRLTPSIIRENMEKLPQAHGQVAQNLRQEYGEGYRQLASQQQEQSLCPKIETSLEAPEKKRHEIVILGGAGQRVITAGEILCTAAMTAGFHATQKNDYHITVLRGPSISELIISPDPIRFTGIEKPSVVVILHRDGFESGKNLIRSVADDALILHDRSLSLEEELYDARGRKLAVDFAKAGIKIQDRALASLAILAGKNVAVSTPMLQKALHYRFSGKVLKTALEVIKKAT